MAKPISIELKKADWMTLPTSRKTQHSFVYARKGAKHFFIHRPKWNGPALVSHQKLIEMYNEQNPHEETLTYHDGVLHGTLTSGQVVFTPGKQQVGVPDRQEIAMLARELANKLDSSLKIVFYDRKQGSTDFGTIAELAKTK